MDRKGILMRLSARTLDLVMTQVAADLRSGVLAIFDGARPTGAVEAPFKEPPVPLVRIPLRNIPRPLDGVIVIDDLPTVEITRSGTASWGQLQTASGQVIADVVVGVAKDEAAEVVVNRTNFEHKGFCAVSFISVRLPAGS
jgi:hypothetical protein